MYKLDKYAGKLYLSFLCSSEHPEQESQYKNAKWYDLLWLLIPIIGILFFILKIESRGE